MLTVGGNWKLKIPASLQQEIPLLMPPLLPFLIPPACRVASIRVSCSQVSSVTYSAGPVKVNELLCHGPDVLY